MNRENYHSVKFFTKKEKEEQVEIKNPLDIEYYCEASSRRTILHQ